jgi:hypothetical protein
MAGLLLDGVSFLPPTSRLGRARLAASGWRVSMSGDVEGDG